MKEEVLYIGDVKVFDHPVIMKCYGLGSCIGLFIKDRITGISGGAHIFVPQQYENDSDDKSYSVEAALQVMLAKMKARGSDLQTLRAKIVGGANLFGGLLNIGALNVQKVIMHLIQNKVFIAAIDIGGSCSRTALFDASSDKLIVNGKELPEGFKNQ